MSLFCAVTSESLRSRELSAHILMTSVGRAMLNGMYMDVMADQWPTRAMDSVWRQLCLLTASALPLDALLAARSHRQ